MKATRPGPIAIVRWPLDLAIVGLVAIVLLAVALARIVPLSGGQTLIIGGPSMEPTLPLGSAVVIQPVAPGSIAVGDIVSIRTGSETAIFTHRVVRLLELDDSPYLETKGDNNPTPDGATVPESAVIGRVALAFPLMGYVIALLSVPSGVAFVLGLGALMILAAVLLDLLEDDVRRRRAASRAGIAASQSPAAMVTLGADTDAWAAAVAALVRPRTRGPELGTAAVAALVRPRTRGPELGTDAILGASAPGLRPSRGRGASPSSRPPVQPRARRTRPARPTA
jgi:signal peptidase